MADKVKYHELKNPGLCGVRYSGNLFTEEEIVELTEGLNKFALTNDGEFIFFYGE